jgi:YD repeat-containing protein
MNNSRVTEEATGVVTRLLIAFILLTFAFGANAESGDGVCAPLYVKSGAIQGTSTCFANAWGNTPINLSNHYCVNEPARITRWCGMPPDDATADNSCPVADPVYPGSGATTIREVDFHSGDDQPFVFSRTYRSRPIVRPDSGFGSLWAHNWQRQLNLASLNGVPRRITAFRDDGHAVVFTNVSGAWHTVDGAPFSLTQSSSSWTLEDLTSGTRETYSAQGVLLSVNVRGGRVVTLTYSDSSTPASVAPAAGLLIAITSHATGSVSYYDLTIRLTYDAKWRIAQLSDSAGNVTQYGYDGYNNLVSVTWPDGNVRRYTYEDTRFTSALTGVVDETGVRGATWAYDAMGRATAVSHPDSQRNVAFSYSPNATTITSSQRSTTLSFSSPGGMSRVTGNDAGYSTSWDASGKLTTDIAPYGKHIDYQYDDSNRPTQATSRNTAGGIAVTTVRYADPVSLRPFMVASPGTLRSFVYDENGNTTGISERRTTDLTGADSFQAAAGNGPIRAYGLVYDSSNQLNFAQMYEDGQVTGEWSLTRDATGNLRSIVDRKNGNVFAVSARDAAHRIVQFSGPGFTATPYYDVRGRLIGFQYWESASPINGNVQHALKITYTYAANGTLTARTGTLSTNLGSDQLIADDELDKWIANIESGILPAGSPLLLSGSIKKLLSAQEAGLEPLCPECVIASGARFAWLIFQLAQDPMWATKHSIPEAVEAKNCKPTGANNAGNINFQTSHYASRLEAEGVDVATAESEVADVVNGMMPDMLPNTNASGRMTIDGVLVEYRVRMLPDGTANVGTIFPVK